MHSLVFLHTWSLYMCTKYRGAPAPEILDLARIHKIHRISGQIRIQCTPLHTYSPSTLMHESLESIFSVSQNNSTLANSSSDTDLASCFFDLLLRNVHFCHAAEDR